MSALPEFTAIIPSYNRGHLLERAAASVWSQTHPPVELVIVDDGSSDDTAAVVRSLDGNVRYVHKENGGGASARNRGVEEARTEWVAFLDSDDLWTSDHLERIAAAIEATDGEADLYFTDVRQTAEEGGKRSFESAGVNFAGPHLLRRDALAWAVAPYQPAMLQGLAVRKTAFEEIGGLWTELSSRHDTHFFYFAFADHPACAVAGVTVEMTSDDDMSNRLTGGVGNRGRRFAECTVRLYTDVLERRSGSDERRVARDLLAKGYKHLAVEEWRAGDRTQAVGSAFRSLRTSPLGIVLSLAPGRRTLPSVRRARAALSS